MAKGETQIMKIIDARNLEPPAPFERVIDALADLAEGEKVMLIINREPMPLYRFLLNNAYEYKTSSFPDGRFEIEIWETLPAAPGAQSE